MNLSLWHEMRVLGETLAFYRRFFFPVIGAYFLAHISFTGQLDTNTGSIGFFTVVETCGLTAAVAFLWAGVYGVLADIAAGREWVMKRASFGSGFRFWPLALIVEVLPHALHFLVFMVLGAEILRPDQLRLVLAVPVFFVVCRVVLCAKFPAERALIDDVSPVDILLMGGASMIGLAFEQAAFLCSGSFFWVKSLLSFGVVAAGAFVLYYMVFAFTRKIAAASVVKDGKELVLINLLPGGMAMGPASVFLRNYPAFFASLRMATPAGYRVRELNRVMWAEEYARPGVLVAISSYTTNSAFAYHAARRFRSAGATVVMGGPHVTFFPEEALEYCDAVVVGPAEGVWADVVRDYEAGAVKPVYQGKCTENDLERLHQYLLDQPPGIAHDTLMVTRGCKFRCYFCSNTPELRTAPRSVSRMVEMLRHIKRKTPAFAFFDPNIYSEPDYAKKLLQAMIPLRMKWASAVSIDIARSDEMLRLLRESGCSNVLIGYEIAPGSEEAGRQKGKFSMADDYLMLSRKLKQAGISIKGHFMFGFPTDDWRTLFRLWWFSFRVFPDQASISFMTPLPGSLFFDDAVREGTLIDLNWTNYNCYKMVCSHPRIPVLPLFRDWYYLVLVPFFFTTSLWGIAVLLLIAAKIYFWVR